MRLLLIDDQAALRQSLRRVCEARGFDVVGEAGNGQEGIDLAASLEPDCIIVDMRMPVMDGLQATSRIKQVLPDVVIVVLSAYDDASLRREAIGAGATEWFLKGEPARVLCDRLTELVKARDEAARAAS